MMPSTRPPFLPPAKSVALCLLLMTAPWLPGQAGRTPTAEDVRAMQAAFRAERDVAVKQDISKRFLPALFINAEKSDARGEVALKAGRLLHAAADFRQARWQLPYQTPDVPEDVVRIFGSLRLRHSGEVTCLALAPDGGRLATGSRDGTVKVWDLTNGHEACTFRGHTGQVRAVAFRPDGKQVASAGGDGSVRLWDPATGKPHRAIPWPGNYVTRVAFSPDGKWVFAGADDRTLRLFRVADGKEHERSQPLRQTMTSMALGDDGTLLAVGIGDGSFRLWKVDKLLEGQPAFWEQNDPTGPTVDVAVSPDKRQVARCGPREVKFYNAPVPGQPFGNEPQKSIANPDPAANFTCAAYGRDGKAFFTGSGDGLIRVWEVASGKAIAALKGHTAAVHALRPDAIGKYLYSASGDHTARVWQFDAAAQARDFLGHSAAVWSGRFNPDGSRLVTASADKTVRVWDAFTGKQEHSLKGPEGPLTCAAYSPDGKFIVAGGADKKVFVWRADKGDLLRALEGHESTVTCLSFNGDGSRLATGGADQKITLWDTNGFKKLVTLDDPAVVAAVAFLPDGSRVASGDTDAEIRLWDAKTGKVVAKWQGHNGSVSSLAVSADGKFLASGGADQLVRVWDLADPGKASRTLTGHAGPVASVAFHKDGRHIASAGADQVVKLWKLDAAGGKEIQSFRGHKDYVGSVAFSPDGHALVSASSDKTVKVWEITSREIPLLAEHTGSVDVVAVSPDGKAVASGAADRTIKFWDPATGGAKRTLLGHTGKLTALVFSPDGKRLFSSATDRTLRMWDVASGDPVAQQPAHRANFNNLLNPARALTTTPDGTRLLAWVPGNERFTTLKSYDPESGKESFTYSDTGRNVLSVCFSKDGKRAAAGARDGSVRVIDLDLQQAVPGGDWFVFDKEGGVSALTFDPDRRTLYCGGTNGEVKAAAVADRTVSLTFKAHADAVSACVVSPDGKRLATAGHDNLVKLWELPGAKPLRSWRLQPPSPARDAFVRQLAFTPRGDLVTANANTTLYLLQGK